MNKVQKFFDPDTLFPFELVYKDTKDVGVELPYHFHEWYEIVYVYDGDGTFFIDQSIQRMEKGSIFIIPGNTLHHAVPDTVNPVTSTAIFFNPLLVHHRTLGDAFSYFHLFDECRKQHIFKCALDESEQVVFEDFIDTIQLETHQQKSGYRHAALLELQKMLLQLDRIVTSQRGVSSSSEFSGPTWMKNILGYIEENYTEEISLQELAQYGNISTAHLSRVFKQMTGFNITEYVTTKKVIKAKELLLNTDEKVSTIAFQCGFESLPHFYRTFKKIANLTPANFRKNNLQEK